MVTHERLGSPAVTTGEPTPNLARLIASRFCADAGVQALLYGALVLVVREGGSAFEASIVSAAALVPPLLLGLSAGVFADRLPRRIALSGAYVAQAAACLIAAALASGGLAAMVIVVFAVMAIGQVSGPTESAILPDFVDEARLPRGTSLLSLASGTGAGFGTAVLAPFVVALADERAIFVVSGLLLVAAAIPIGIGAGLRTAHITSVRGPANVRDLVRWFGNERAVGSMMLLLGLVTTTHVILTSLGPRYVQELFDLDPSESVYVFAPSGAGMLIALAATPGAVGRFGSRRVALAGFALTALALFGLGLTDYVAVIDPVNPLRGLTQFAHIGRLMRTAAVLALPLGVGVGAASIAVSAYLNRVVPADQQGRAFALLGTLKTALALPPLLLVGAAADITGVEPVLVATPLVLLGIAAIAHRRLGPHPWAD